MGILNVGNNCLGILVLIDNEREKNLIKRDEEEDLHGTIIIIEDIEISFITFNDLIL